MNRLSSTAKLGKTPLDIWSDGVTQDYDLLCALDDHPTSASKIPSKIREQKSSLFFWYQKEYERLQAMGSRKQEDCVEQVCHV